MLKPKFVHGVNADQSPKSLLNRLQNEASPNIVPIVPIDPIGDNGDAGNDGYRWSWTLG